jgi:hypothetical protein
MVTPEDTCAKAEGILDRLQQDWNTGYANWSMFEAGNGRSERERASFHGDLKALQLGHGFATILNSLVSQALLAVARITDQSGKDANCLHALNGLIARPEQREHLVEQAEQWFAHLSLDREEPFKGKENRALVETRLPEAIKRMNRFKSGLVRDAIHRTRTQQLAHALPLEGDRATFADIKTALHEAGEILVDLNLVVRGRHVDLPQMIRLHEKVANAWWDTCERGFRLIGDEVVNTAGP